VRGTKRTLKKIKEVLAKRKNLKTTRPISIINRKIVQLSIKSVRKGGEIYGGKDFSMSTSPA